MIREQKMCNDACKAAFAQYNVDIAVWNERWPDACETCNGRGGRTYNFDPSPAGVALSSGYMTEFESCPDCVEKSKCARCGQSITDNDQPCVHCGWNWGKNLGDIAPMPPECCCYEEDLAKQQQESIAAEQQQYDANQQYVASEIARLRNEMETCVCQRNEPDEPCGTCYRRLASIMSLQAEE